MTAKKTAPAAAGLELVPIEGKVEESRAVATVHAGGQSGALLVMLEQVLSNPSFDMDRLDRLWKMQQEILDRQAKADFISAASAMQGELPSIQKRGRNTNTGSMYALWEDTNTAIKPILQKHGFALSFRVNQTGNVITITGVLSHRGGHQETTTIELAPDKGAGRNDVQATGSSVSYGKKYTAGALLNLTAHGEDSDGTSPEALKWEAMAEDFKQAIGDCDSLEALHAIGKQISGQEKMPGPIKASVRKAYAARQGNMREELKAKSAAAGELADKDAAAYVDKNGPGLMP